jgi:hypothetical protein
MLAGLIDRNWLRGGIIAGVSSALSIAIGMEMIVYLAAGGALIALRWVFKEGAGRRMLPYALSLAGSVSILFLIFASYANRQMVCDAISPIWVAIFGTAGGGYRCRGRRRGLRLVQLAPLPDRRVPDFARAGAVVAGQHPGSQADHSAGAQPGGAADGDSGGGTVRPDLGAMGIAARQ